MAQPETAPWVEYTMRMIIEAMPDLITLPPNLIFCGISSLDDSPIKLDLDKGRSVLFEGLPERGLPLLQTIALGTTYGEQGGSSSVRLNILSSQTEKWQGLSPHIFAYAIQSHAEVSTTIDHLLRQAMFKERYQVPQSPDHCLNPDLLLIDDLAGLLSNHPDLASQVTELFQHGARGWVYTIASQYAEPSYHPETAPPPAWKTGARRISSIGDHQYAVNDTDIQFWVPQTR